MNKCKESWLSCVFASWCTLNLPSFAPVRSFFWYWNSDTLYYIHKGISVLMLPKIFRIRLDSLSRCKRWCSHCSYIKWIIYIFLHNLFLYDSVQILNEITLFYKIIAIQREIFVNIFMHVLITTPSNWEMFLKDWRAGSSLKFFW